MCYILQFLYSTRFMANSLLNLTNNLSEGIHEIKCKYGGDDENYETCGNTYEAWEFFLEHTILYMI